MKKITAKQARALYEQGKPFIMVPCNMRPDSMFADTINSERYCMEMEFDRVVNAFVYYNCNNAEVGRRPSYYTVD